jgi:diguanylate cyclase (GGDEF)-like protein
MTDPKPSFLRTLLRRNRPSYEQLETQLAIERGLREAAEIREARAEFKAADFKQQAYNNAVLAFTDDLTGMPNRRFLDRILDGHMAYATAYGTPLSLLMVDIDRFKGVNDRDGHAAGDEVIKRVAEAMMSGVRDTDITARLTSEHELKELGIRKGTGRWGGEEFVTVLPGANLAQAATIAQRLRHDVRAESVDLSHIDTKSGAKSVDITISVGVTQFYPGRDDKHTLLERLDKALYHAKGNLITGRDRVALVGEDGVFKKIHRDVGGPSIKHSQEGVERLKGLHRLPSASRRDQPL